MAMREYIIRYRDYRTGRGGWEEALFCLGDWPYGDAPRPETIEDHPEGAYHWFSVQFCLVYEAGADDGELRRRAKSHAQAQLCKSYPDAKALDQVSAG